MTNWKERAEQEKLRLAREQQAGQLAKDQAGRDREATIRERLGLLDSLGIQRTLGEIQRDIWRGQGEISDNIFVISKPDAFNSEHNNLIRNLRVSEDKARDGFGFRSVRLLLGPEWRANTITEPVYKRVYGEYVEGTTKYSMGEDRTEYVKRKGWRNEVDGHRVVGAEVVPGASYELRAALLYYVRADRYLLEIIGTYPAKHTGGWMRKQTEFSTIPVVEKLAGFLDQAFLEYATLATNIPDFAASRRAAEAEASIIRGRIGEITIKRIQALTKLLTWVYY